MPEIDLDAVKKKKKKKFKRNDCAQGTLKSCMIYGDYFLLYKKEIDIMLEYSPTLPLMYKCFLLLNQKIEVWTWFESDR